MGEKCYFGIMLQYAVTRPCGRAGGSGALNEIQGKGWREKINVVLKSHFLAQEDGLRDTEVRLG